MATELQLHDSDRLLPSLDLLASEQSKKVAPTNWKANALLLLLASG